MYFDCLDYAGYNGMPAHCVALTNGNVVVVKEVADNKGMSVTNAIEVVAATVCSKYGIAPETLELYDRGEQRLSRVWLSPEMDGFQKTKWTAADIDDFEKHHFPLSLLGPEDSH